MTGYRPGRMGVAEGVVLVFISGITPLFLSIWSIVIERSATGGWLTPLITGPSALAMVFVLIYILDRVPGDLYDVAVRLLGKAAGNLLTALLILVFFGNCVLQLRQYSENTLLTALPYLDIAVAMGWFALMAAIAVCIGIESLARAAKIVLTFGMAGFALILLALYERFDIHNVMPWLGSGLPVVKIGFGTTGVFLGTFILAILAPSFQNTRTLKQAAVIGVALGTTVRTVTLFVYTGVFSVAVGTEKLLPFFELTRLVYLNRFVQRIESFFILIWAFYGMTIIAFFLFLAVYLSARLFGLPSVRPLVFPLAIIAVELAMLIPDAATTNHLTLMLEGTIQTYVAFGLPLILLAAWRLRGGRGGGNEA
ncbi:GerAB/ArcD/ProY family transporter [Anaeroselena agilis]|uniref:GerAB/ArcD/ProY family transporter n=1 Tax=Anaeroselena agilis TaxID=3063788 RepID=A0ABU3NZ18_9FIRM|nr:GerAB/ArcD/ProY family transporter [Selenomonadales bacterium 4137-cl]